MIVSILLLLLFILLVICLIVLLFFGLYIYTVIPIFFLLIDFLFFRSWIYHRCRKYININKNIIRISDFIQKKDCLEGFITFKSNNSEYYCKNNDSVIRFNLNGFLLKKSFIRAFVIRQIRYKTISNKLKIAKLFSIRLKCKLKYNKLFLVIDNHKYLIYSNGVSKNTFLSSEISKSKYGVMYLSRRVFKTSNNIEEIDEKNIFK